MEDDWVRSGRQWITLRARETPARVRERQSCFDRLAREFDAVLFTHANVAPSQGELADTLRSLDSPQRCVQPWLPRAEPRVPADPVLAQRVESLRAQLVDCSILIEFDTAAATQRLSELRKDVEAVPFEPLAAEYRYVDAWATIAEGDTTEGVARLEEAYFAALEIGEVGLASWSLGHLVRGLVELGRYEEARIWVRRGLADSADDPVDSDSAATRASLLIEAALVARKLGRLAEAGRSLEEAEMLADRVNSDEVNASIRPGLYAELARYEMAAQNPAGQSPLTFGCWRSLRTSWVRAPRSTAEP